MEEDQAMKYHRIWAVLAVFSATILGCSSTDEQPGDDFDIFEITRLKREDRILQRSVVLSLKYDLVPTTVNNILQEYLFKHNASHRFADSLLSPGFDVFKMMAYRNNNYKATITSLSAKYGLDNAVIASVLIDYWLLSIDCPPESTTY